MMMRACATSSPFSRSFHKCKNVRSFDIIMIATLDSHWFSWLVFRAHSMGCFSMFSNCSKKMSTVHVECRLETDHLISSNELNVKLCQHGIIYARIDVSSQCTTLSRQRMCVLPERETKGKKCAYYQMRI